MSDMTLTEFLTARLDEDEVTAKGSKADVASGKTLGVPPSWMTGVADRVLAEVAAKRYIIELRYSWNLQAERMTEPPFGPILQTHVNTADTILRVLARVYSGHPDYREDWDD